MNPCGRCLDGCALGGYPPEFLIFVIFFLASSAREEPAGGAHNDYDQTARYLDSALSERLAEAVSCSQEDRLKRRYDKLRAFGRWGTEGKDTGPTPPAG